MENQKGLKDNVETIGAVFIAAVVIFFFFVWPDITGKQIGDYPAQRTKDGTLIPLNRTIYKVNPLTHTIIYWTPGIYETPRKLVNCAVRNKKNWIGYYSDASGTVEMRGGKLVTDDPNIIQIGRCRWWLMHFEIIK